jgi:hypothetical protein
MARFDDVLQRIRIPLARLGMSVDGPTHFDVEYGRQQIGLRNRSGVRVVLELTEELIADAADGIAVVTTVERSGVLNMLADAQEPRTLGVMRLGKIIEESGQDSK